MNIPITSIIIGKRQRIELGDIDDLADSIRRLGQIQAIGVNERNELIWGRRRLAACVKLGWTEIDAIQRTGLTQEQEQEIELEEDIKRKDRTWQEKCLAVAKLYRIKARNARSNGESWTVRTMASFTGMSKSSVAYMIQVADALATTPKDTGIWNCDGYMSSIKYLLEQSIAETTKVIEARRAANPTPYFVAPPVNPFIEGGPVQALDQTGKAPIQPTAPAFNPRMTLRDRALLYNKAFEHLGPPNTPLFYVNKENKEFIHSFWFVGGGNISELYGSYQIEYLKRIECLFPDAVKVVHLFVGSLPPSDKYVRVGLPQVDGIQPDITCDVHELSSHLPFKADLIYADPPYSIEDSEHYANSMINRERVMQECAAVLEPGGFLVWLDQALPIFSNNDLNLVGGIAYIRSTGNRFRVVSIFRKPLTPTPSCPPNTKSSEPIGQVLPLPSQAGQS